MHVILDVSRLLFSIRRAAPSGIDRVEMAYAKRWIAGPPGGCTFVAQLPAGGFSAVPRTALAGLLDAIEATWDGVPGAQRQAWRAALPIVSGLGFGAGKRALRDALSPVGAVPGRAAGRSVFLLMSHRALDRAAAIAPLRRAGAAFVPFVHDLIPLSHPEYARPPQVRRHGARVATVAALADGVVVNSAATAASLRAELAARGLPAPAVTVAPLGIGTRRAPAVPSPEGSAPYFVCLGTIEPRKNHLLLLHIWRDLAACFGDAAPRLLLLGRRGWENENILDLLERCAALRGLVRECGTPGDAEVASLLAGSRALLFPSFAEGYGLPLAEALALGVPALCSELPALREVGGAVPDYLDPLDGSAWRRAVLDYADPASAARAAQLSRLAGWHAPGWDAHFEAVDALLERVVSGRAAAAPSAAPRPAPELEGLPA